MEYLEEDHAVLLAESSGSRKFKVTVNSDRTIYEPDKSNNSFDSLTEDDDSSNSTFGPPIDGTKISEDNNDKHNGTNKRQKRVEEL